MDIHLIATGRGESTFIIMPDGTKMQNDTPSYPLIYKSQTKKSRQSEKVIFIDCGRVDCLLGLGTG